MQWVAKYRDGSELREFEGPKENSFYDIDKPNVSSFHLVGRDLDVGFNTADGVFCVQNVEVGFRIPGVVDLTGNPVGDYADLIQYKSAYADFSPATGQQRGKGILSHNIGYKTSFDGIWFKPIFTIPVDEKEHPYFSIWLVSEEALSGRLEIVVAGHIQEYPLEFKPKVGNVIRLQLEGLR